MELESIGKNIRKFRLMRNLRQEDLAEMAGLSINYVGALERGEKIPSLETFIVLLNALEVSSDMVLSSLLVEKHQADASRLMDRMQNLPAYDIERILAVVDVLIQYHEILGLILLGQYDKDGRFLITELLSIDGGIKAEDLLHL